VKPPGTAPLLLQRASGMPAFGPSASSSAAPGLDSDALLYPLGETNVPETDYYYGATDFDDEFGFGDLPPEPPGHQRAGRGPSDREQPTLVEALDRHFAGESGPASAIPAGTGPREGAQGLAARYVAAGSPARTPAGVSQARSHDEPTPHRVPRALHGSTVRDLGDIPL